MFISTARIGMCVFVLALSACAQPGSDYVEQVQSAPIPQDAAGRQAACDDVRSQIADQQSRASIAESGALPPMLAMSAERQFSARIAALQNRASDLQCSADFSNSTPFAPAANGSPIDQCIAACTTSTSRSKEQCFDACNH